MLAVTIHAGIAKPARMPDRNGFGDADIGVGVGVSCPEIELASAPPRMTTRQFEGAGYERSRCRRIKIHAVCLFLRQFMSNFTKKVENLTRVAA